jgi:tRNA pseudouridine65 synthase/23S rRNA pseudouridine1911/1915/1917 synthase
MGDKNKIVLEKLVVSHLIGDKTRIYDYLVGKFEIISTRKGVKKAFKRKQILLNGEYARSATYLKDGDNIELLELDVSDNKSFEIDLEILFEDEEIAIVVKPAGLIVSGNKFKTLQNALQPNLKESLAKDKLPTPLTTHRLDSQTSGLVIVAKTYSSRIKLGEMFEKRDIHKTYHAIVQGKLEGLGEINTVVEAKSARTLYQSVQVADSVKNDFISLVKLSPISGRKHQIRIHLSSLGHPIVGDKLYGEKDNILKHKGLFLAATSLKFEHPKTGKQLSFDTSLPDKFMSLMSREQKWRDRINSNEKKS